MKKRIYFLILLVTLVFGQKISAEPLTLPVPVPRDNTALENKSAMIPVVLVLLAEMTAADVALIGVGTAATALTITYYVTTPPPPIYWNFPVSPDEMVDVPNGGGGSNGGGTPPGGGKPWIPKMQPEDQFILLINLATAGYQGYLKLSQGGPNTSSVADQLTALYFVDQKFAERINQMQADYDSGKMVAIPVYKPGSMIFDHFNYIFKVDEKPVRTDPKPGDDQWNAGVQYVKSAFNRLNSGAAGVKDYNLLGKFVDGDCLGDPQCRSLQNELSEWSSNLLGTVTKPELISVLKEVSTQLVQTVAISNELSTEEKEFLGEVFLNPDLLDKMGNFLRFLRILDRLSDDDPVKSKLLAILCNKFPTIPLCEGYTPGSTTTRKMTFGDILEKENQELIREQVAFEQNLKAWETLKVEAAPVAESTISEQGIVISDLQDDESLAIQDIISILNDPEQHVDDPKLLAQMQELKEEFEATEVNYELTQQEFDEKMIELEKKANDLLEKIPEGKLEVEKTQKKRTGNYKGRIPGSKNKPKITELPATELTEPVSGDQVFEAPANTPTVSEALDQIAKAKEIRAEKLGDDYLQEKITDQEYDDMFLALEQEAEYLGNKLVEFDYADPKDVGQGELADLVERFRKFVEVEKSNRSDVFTDEVTDVIREIQGKNPDDKSPELASLIGNIRDIQAEVVRLQDDYFSQKISKNELKDLLLRLETRFNKLMKKFRDYVKANYNLPDSVWRNGEKGKFHASWVDKVLKELNGDTSKPVFKLGLQIYQACERTFRPIMEEAGIWNRPTGN